MLCEVVLLSVASKSHCIFLYKPGSNVPNNLNENNIRSEMPSRKVLIYGRNSQKEIKRDSGFPKTGVLFVCFNNSPL